MSNHRMDKKDAIDVAPAQSHIHQEVVGMHDKTLVIREPYGKSGMFGAQNEPEKEYGLT
jgi:hypothetical protein